jgi:hypothetical protein
VLYVIVPLALAVAGLAIALSWWLTHRHSTPPQPGPRTRRDPYSQVKHHRPKEHPDDD